MPKINLTLKEVKELAEFCGFNVTPCDFSFDSDEMDSEITVFDSSANGLVDRDGPTVTINYYSTSFYFVNCPEEGCIGLGNPIKTETMSFEEFEAQKINLGDRDGVRGKN